jgi:hypothetical protein
VVILLTLNTVGIVEYYLTISGDKYYRKDHPAGERGDYEFSLCKAYWDSVWDNVLDQIMESK